MSQAFGMPLADAWLDRSVGAMSDAVNDGLCEPVDLVHAALARVSSRAAGPAGLNAVLAVDHDGATRDAEVVQSHVLRGSRMPLAGIPLLVKDNLATMRLPLRADRASSRDTSAHSRRRRCAACVRRERS